MIFCLPNSWHNPTRSFCHIYRDAKLYGGDDDHGFKVQVLRVACSFDDPVSFPPPFPFQPFTVARSTIMYSNLWYNEEPHFGSAIVQRSTMYTIHVVHRVNFH